MISDLLRRGHDPERRILPDRQLPVQHAIHAPAALAGSWMVGRLTMGARIWVMMPNDAV